ncbi:MAG: hypothetical protein RIQ56_18 [Candidatus Parcubacteria bacterium]
MAALEHKPNAPFRQRRPGTESGKAALRAAIKNAIAGVTEPREGDVEFKDGVMPELLALVRSRGELFGEVDVPPELRALRQRELERLILKSTEDRNRALSQLRAINEGESAQDTTLSPEVRRLLFDISIEADASSTEERNAEQASSVYAEGLSFIRSAFSTASRLSRRRAVAPEEAAVVGLFSEYPAVVRRLRTLPRPEVSQMDSTKVIPSGEVAFFDANILALAGVGALIASRLGRDGGQYDELGEEFESLVSTLAESFGELPSVEEWKVRTEAFIRNLGQISGTETGSSRAILLSAREAFDRMHAASLRISFARQIVTRRNDPDLELEEIRPLVQQAFAKGLLDTVVSGGEAVLFNALRLRTAQRVVSEYEEGDLNALKPDVESLLNPKIFADRKSAEALANLVYTAELSGIKRRFLERVGEGQNRDELLDELGRLDGFPSFGGVDYLQELSDLRTQILRQYQLIGPLQRRAAAAECRALIASNPQSALPFIEALPSRTLSDQAFRLSLLEEARLASKSSGAERDIGRVFDRVLSEFEFDYVSPDEALQENGAAKEYIGGQYKEVFLPLVKTFCSDPENLAKLERYLSPEGVSREQLKLLNEILAYRK